MGSNKYLQKKFQCVYLLLLIILSTCHFVPATADDEDSDIAIINEFLENNAKESNQNLAKAGDPSKSSQERVHEISASPPSRPREPSPSTLKPATQLILPKIHPNEEVVDEQQPCSCVKYFLCDIDNGTVIVNGVGVIDIRLGNTKTSPCDHYFDICCKTMKQPEVPPVHTTYSEHTVCGQRNMGGVGFRITGALDGEAQFGEFPWMAAIVRQEHQVDKPPLNIFVCGGSLIHPKVVLTAAHCVFGKHPSELKVRLGEWDTQTLDELYQHQDRFVTKIVVHEDYYMGALYNDVALLFLDDEIKFAPNVDTVCLPPPDISFDGQRCVASGWGKDSFEKEGKYQVILKRLDLPVVPRDNCEAALRKTRLGPYFRLDKSFVCAGGEPGRDTCRGDGGSPLVCQLPNSKYYVQFGIVAWGIGCGEGGIPGVYVNVPKFVPWIEEKLIQAKLDTKYYKSTA